MDVFIHFLFLVLTPPCFFPSYKKHLRKY
uniref:Uncharacterized protein n=1 Tax=Arundo donax TaxID=35708 RepID=A0A0A9HR98_ARUDO